MPRMRRALALSLALPSACAGGEDPRCPGVGEPDMMVTPTVFAYDALEDGASVPIYVPAQGGVWTELDIELTGLREEELSVLDIRAVVEGGTATGSFQASMSYPVECRPDDTILLERIGIAFTGVAAPMEIDGRAASFVVQMQLTGGQDPLTREYDVVLEARTLN
jgi:hypothetical protein